LTAFYVIEEVKKFDPYCRGATRLGICAIDRTGNGRARVYPAGKLMGWIPKLQRIDKQAKANLSGEITKALQEYLDKKKVAEAEENPPSPD